MSSQTSFHETTKESHNRSNLSVASRQPSSQDLDSAEKAVILDATPAPQDARPIHGWKWFIACVAMYLTAFLYGLDTTIAADIQPDIVKSLGEIEKLSWIGTGFPLGSVAVILPLGYAYGIFQIKTLYLASIVLFEAGSALCGGAPNMNAEIVGRIIAGAGGAGMYLGLLNYISAFTTIRERNFYNSLCGMFWGAGCICGPLIGGGFAVSSAGWRWSFYINLVLAAVFAPVLLIYLPNYQPESRSSFSAKMKSLDWLGVVLIASVFTTYTLALTFGGSQWSWGSYKFAIMISFFGIILAAFIITQYLHLFTTAERRIFPIQFLKSRSMLLVYFTTATSISVTLIGAYYIPLYFQFARGDTAITAAVRLLPFIVFVIASILLNGVLMPIFGYYQPWYIVAGVFQIISGSLWYATVKEDSSPAKIYGYSILMGIGCVAAQAGYSIAAAKTMARDPTQIPAAIGFVNVAQIGTIVITLTISGTIFQNLAFQNLKNALAVFDGDYTDQQIRSALAGTQAAVFQIWSEEEREAAIAAIIQAMNNVFILVIVAGVVTLLSGLAMRREKLFMTAVAGG